MASIEYSIFMAWGIGLILIIKTILNIFSGKTGSNSLQLGWVITRRDQQPFSFWFQILIQLLGAVISIKAGFAVNDWVEQNQKLF